MLENSLPLFFPQELHGVMSYIEDFKAFEFIFMYGVRVCSNFTDVHVAVQLLTPLAEGTVFPVLYILAFIVKKIN